MICGGENGTNRYYLAVFTVDVVFGTLVSISNKNTGVEITASTLVTKPHMKYIKEGGIGTIAACFQSTSVGNNNLLIPVFRNDIKWLWMNVKSFIRIVYLKTLPQTLDNTSLIKVKPLDLCLPCSLVLKVAASFCGKIEATAVTLLCCLLD